MSERYYCSVKGCYKAATTRGLCKSHYQKLRRTGELKPIPPSWSPEDKETLRRLVGEGKGSPEIAVIMGRSRSSVCGEAARLGLRFGKGNLRAT